jgi:hypothetical protein
MGTNTRPDLPAHIQHKNAIVIEYRHQSSAGIFGSESVMETEFQDNFANGKIP